MNPLPLLTRIAQSRDHLAQVGLAGLRVAFGLLMAFGHGWGKLTSWSEKADTFADPIGVGPTASLALAILAEFFCALLLALGLATRAVVVPLIITMAVAAFIVHADDPFQRKELAILYLLVFGVLFVTGGGRYSLDGVLWPRIRAKLDPAP